MCLQLLRVLNLSIVVLILCLSNHREVFAQDSLKAKKVKVLPVPAFGYSPETKTYLGAVTLFTLDFYRDSLTRTSNAKFEFNYTFNKQIVLESEWNYFFKEEKWFLKGKLHFSEYPDLYYGIGTNTPESNKTTFFSRRALLETSVLKRIGKKIFTGLNVKYIDYDDVGYDAPGTMFPELKGGSSVGVGYSVVKDTRNNLLTPTTGSYINFGILYNFARKNYWELALDLRHYKTWKNKFTLATRFLNEVNLGTLPFYDMAFLGGDKYVRGYYYGRYRDNNLSTLQTELRVPLFWRFYLATFGGVSNIYSTENKFSFTSSKFNYGLGIRFLVDKKDNTFLRMDYAIGQGNNSGFYIAFGESF